MQRDLFIDRLRVLLTAMVVFHHSAVTYGASGGWFYREVPVSAGPSSLLLTFFSATNQAYFMGFFFLLAGYYTPRSLERKGTARYLLDRLWRLGLPLLGFGLALGPITIWLAQLPKGHSLFEIARYLWQRRQFEIGPLWFAEALILFALGYCGWRAARGVRTLKLRPVPRDRVWLASAIAIGAAAFAIRQLVPVGKNVFGMQLGFFASYVFLFGVGISAARQDWLRLLDRRQARRWMAVSAIAVPLLPVTIVASRAAQSNYGNFVGGFSVTTAMYAFWEPFVAFGIIAWLLVWFRENGNQPSAGWSWMARRAYTVYIIHPPVLVGISMMLRSWGAPALVKFAAAGSISVAACWVFADLLLRLPGVRHVV
jgi:peptidoglycan/LPS O-acetylase OafA/YrhL